MRNLKLLWLCSILSVISLAATKPAENDNNEDASRIIQTALQPSPLENNLR